MIKVAVIGGGAAGFFAAIHCKLYAPECDVIIFEKSNKLLAKVRVSGGGRCNVTHACFDNSKLVDFYPRGSKELRSVFSKFSTKDTVEWFELHGVKLKTESDGRMFPITDNSETIIDCLIKEAKRNGIIIKMNHVLGSFAKRADDSFEITFQNSEKYICNKVIVASGGSPHLKSYEWIEKLGHTIIPPIPSLFTFNIPQSPLKSLEGISVKEAKIKLQGSNFEETGPLLITHWGISGPAVIKLSAWAARWLHNVNYETYMQINWMPELHETSIKEKLSALKLNEPVKKVYSVSAFGLPLRLWNRLCELSNIDLKDNFADINKQKINRLTEYLNNTILHLKGKTTYKEEFVTCGGINLKEVDLLTMESKKMKGLYFAGEILNIDGITGGFNFQAAWSTGYLAGVAAAAVH